MATAGNLHCEVAQVRCVACSPFVSTQRGAMLAKSAKTHLGAPASLQHARPPGGVHTQFKQGPLAAPKPRPFWWTVWDVISEEQYVSEWRDTKNVLVWLELCHEQHI